VLDYVAQYVPALRRDLDAGRRPAITWIDYSWKLNSLSNRPASD
jgi:hypothetical protein